MPLHKMPARRLSGVRDDEQSRASHNFLRCYLDAIYDFPQLSDKMRETPPAAK